jgi:hypothetical protein
MNEPVKVRMIPEPIAAYFAADKADGAAVAACFVENAVVKDEGKTHRGRTAIAQWRTDASTKYTYTSTPFACERAGSTMIVTSHLVGNFPGSPVDLRYFFELEGDLIASLEIML